MKDITAVQRDSANGDGFTYDLTQEITGFQRDGTSVNLTNGTVTGGTQNNMSFDGCGNRTVLNGVNQAFNNMNQPTGTGISNDNKGNLKTYNGWTYTYDAQNRLITATNGTTTANFKYDGKNRQISRSITGSAITFSVWDDWELVEEYTTSNVRTSAYLQGAHGPIKSLLNNIYFYQDELGSTSHIASSAGSLLEYYTYDLNGKLRVYNAGGVYQPNATPQVKDLFTGERYVSELSLYDLRNRFMSPDLARFLQPDPIGFKGDASNLYRYCGNDWANKTDPTGLLIDGFDPGGSLQLRNTQQDAMGAEAYQQMMRSAVVTAQATGGPADPRDKPSKRNTTKGSPGDPNAPTSLVNQPKNTEGFRNYSVFHNQVMKLNRETKQEMESMEGGYYQEHVETFFNNTNPKIGVQTNNNERLLFKKGDVEDRLGLQKGDIGNVTGEIRNHLWYTIYQRQPGPDIAYKWYNVGPVFEQRMVIGGGTLTPTIKATNIEVPKTPPSW